MKKLKDIRIPLLLFVIFVMLPLSANFVSPLYMVKIEAHNQHVRSQIENLGVVIDEVQSDHVRTIATQFELNLLKKSKFNLDEIVDSMMENEEFMERFEPFFNDMERKMFPGPELSPFGMMIQIQMDPRMIQEMFRAGASVMRMLGPGLNFLKLLQNEKL